MPLAIKQQAFKGKMKKHFFLLSCLIVYFWIGQHFSFYLPCPIHWLTGFYCPGCGITRMILSIFQGNFVQAFHYNPLLFLLIPFFLFYFVDLFLANYKQKKSFIHLLEPQIWYILIAIFLIYGIFRNIPGFDFLKPVTLS